MSVARVREINARLRAAGFTVHEWAGWESRGNGQTSAYEGGIVHHAASPFGMAYPVLVNGRSGLTGPLCNWAGNADGSLTVIAAHPANHAGASGGRSMGPLPTTTLFNRRVVGLEIVYPGMEPMRPAQYRAALAWARVVADVVGGGDIQRIRAHAETSITGKWDPGYAPGKTIDMTAFRAAALTVLSGDDDMAGEVADAVFRDMQARLNGLPAGDPYRGKAAYDVLVDAAALSLQNRAAITALAAKVAAGRGEATDTEAKILAAVHAQPTGGQVDVPALAAALGPLLERIPADQIAELVEHIPQATRLLLAQALTGQGAQS